MFCMLIPLKILGRFGFSTATSIDTALEKEDVTLVELLEDEELLQETRGHNAKLLEFLLQVFVLLFNI
jgi:serine/threonine-protein phosphatase 6 regulatory subunit 3